MVNYGGVTAIEIDGRNIIRFFVKKGTRFNLSIKTIEEDLGKWIKPSNKICKNYGGKIYFRNLFGVRIDDYDVCKARWSDAKKICRASGGKLPTINSLKEAVLNCGGIWDNNDDISISISNVFNDSYTSCIEKKGFYDNTHWTSEEKSSSQAWGVAMGAGYSTGEIKDIRATNVMCEKEMKFSEKNKNSISSPTNSTQTTNNSKWITPSESTCKSNGGKVDDDGCKANWSDAKDICSASGGSLPTIDELKKVFTDCGGEVTDNANKTYQSCYKQKGFNSNHYWSSSSVMGNGYNAWFVNFRGGYVYRYNKAISYYVRCVRDGQ